MAAQMDKEQIRELQQALKDQGQQVEVDGVWGPGTQQALRAFQQSEGLQATGQPTPETLAALGVESQVGLGGSSGGSSAGASRSGTSATGGAESPSSQSSGSGSQGTSASGSSKPSSGSQTGNTPGSDADRQQPKPGGQ